MKVFFVLLLFCVFAPLLSRAASPNVIFILCDDLGSGDVRLLNPEGKIATPHMDRIGREGMIFSDAHTPSSVCTPTRYGTMTGRYSWRTKLQHGVLGGLSPRLIEKKRLTVPAMLKQAGYETAAIGKWHLGMDWVVKPGQTVAELNIESSEQAWSVDFTKPHRNGPLSVGFDYYFGIAASLDMVPYCFIQGDRVTAQPTEKRALMMVHGKEGQTTRVGPAAPGFTGYEVLGTFIDHAIAWIQEKASAAKSGKPFFLYLPLASPHTPILPNPAWRGKSGLNAYADFVMETDSEVGRLLQVLDEKALAQDTLIVFTSDNGCSPSANFPELLEKGHNPSGRYRGTKADLYEGGHRVPFLVRWPARIRGGQTSSHLVCLTDFMATMAEITGSALPADAAEDSFSFLPVLLGQAAQGPERDALVSHSVGGYFAIREGSWKLCLAPGSGGWSPPRPGKEPKDAPALQLFHLGDDLGETRNLQAEHPEIVARLMQKLETLVVRGRSTPGPDQNNAVPVDLWKKKSPKAGQKTKEKKPS
jgi:arylsulfatase A-like enzyme